MLYMKEDEFTKSLREKGFVILQNEPLADHYFNLLKGAFRDLRMVKSNKEQIIFITVGCTRVHQRLDTTLTELIQSTKSVSRALAEVETILDGFIPEKGEENSVKRAISG